MAPDTTRVRTTGGTACANIVIEEDTTGDDIFVHETAQSRFPETTCLQDSMGIAKQTCEEDCGIALTFWGGQ